MDEQLMQILSVVTPKVSIIAAVCEVSEDDVHKYLDAEMDALEEIEHEYYEHEWPRMQRDLKAMREDIPAHERHEMRRRYIQEQIQELKPRYLKTLSPILEKKLKKLMFEAKIHMGQVEGLTTEQIAAAREYPITKLIQHRNLMALCPFHKEKNPSLNLKKNFYFCHGCGEHGDVIDFVMKRDNLTFKQAIAKLL